MKAYVTLKSEKDIMEFYDLKEDHYYQVWVQNRASNPRHQCLLMTGFKNGNYMYLICQGTPIDIKTIHSISIIKCLGPLVIDTKIAHKS